MSRKEEVDIFKCHPELVLVSRSPYTFEGFLSLPKNCDIHGRNLIKIKLKVPFYPTLEDMIVYFSNNFKHRFNSDLKKLISDSIRNNTSLHSFLNRLKEHFILQTKQDCTGSCMSQESNVYTSIKNRLDELKKLLLQSSEIKVSSNHNLSNIKLTSNSVSVIVENKKGNLWKIVNSEIPNFLDDKSIENTQLSLSHILNIFISKMESLKRIWSELNEIDTNCYIIDPLRPKPNHLYRRIYLTESVSLMLTLDPSQILQNNVPSVKLLGSESEVSKYCKDFTNKLRLWDSENSVLENLCLLLNLTEFPQAPEKNGTQLDNGIINEADCCICFEEELDDDQSHNVICNRCKKRFHLTCLRQWLETVNGKPITFGHIQGECPICREKMICPGVK